MNHELISKKLEQIKEVMNELERLLRVSIGEFVRDLTAIRAAERNFQLAVDMASDMNTHILLELGGKTPDTYRESFAALEREGIFSHTLASQLIESAKVRNILVHEYDFEEDYEKFYRAAQECIPAYREYMKVVYDYMSKQMGG